MQLISNRRTTHYFTLNIDPRDLKPTKSDPRIKYLDLTRQINRIIDKLGIECGIVNIQIKHTTAALSFLKVQENETGLIEHDLPNFFKKLLPADVNFTHDREERIAALGGNEPRNAISHLLASVFPVSITLNIHNYILDCGTYQSVILFDFDSENHPGRQISIIVENEAPRGKPRGIRRRRIKKTD